MATNESHWSAIDLLLRKRSEQLRARSAGLRERAASLASKLPVCRSGNSRGPIRARPLGNVGAPVAVKELIVPSLLQKRRRINGPPKSLGMETKKPAKNRCPRRLR
jgi:hypothetical protein